MVPQRPLPSRTLLTLVPPVPARCGCAGIQRGGRYHLEAVRQETLLSKSYAGTPSGAQFALLPPDNATGNFTKVVQRIPVKIVLDRDPSLADLIRPGKWADFFRRKRRRMHWLPRINA
jgi:hypothetical protein